MSTFDELPEDIRARLRELCRGEWIYVPKGLSAKEHADRAAKVREIYAAQVANGADPKRLAQGLAKEFGLDLSHVYAILRGESGELGQRSQ